MSQASSTAQKPVNPLRVRDFRLLWIGESVSLLGDQFYLIALPWLVLQMTGSALALGTVLALASIPRALFMLIGGAFVDRFSPRSVMFASNFIRMILVGLLALLVLIGSIQLWMLYVLALAFGTADAFFFPAESAIVPALLDSDQLELGNTLTQGVATLSMFVGPALAGIVIAILASSSTKATPDMAGIGVAFALDTLSFLASLVTLWIMHAHNSEEGTEGSNVWELDQSRAGLPLAKRHPTERFHSAARHQSVRYRSISSRRSGTGETQSCGRRSGIWHLGVRLWRRVAARNHSRKRSAQAATGLVRDGSPERHRVS